MRYVALAFTGYRTEKLPFPPTPENFSALRERIARVIREQAGLGVKYFMSGVCHGADLIAAETVLELKEELGISLWCAVPFRGHEKLIPEAELPLYKKVLSGADGVIVVHDGYPSKGEYGRLFNDRNRFMVDKCDGLIAICPGSDIQPGGTRNTVDMARRAGKPVIFVL